MIRIQCADDAAGAFCHLEFTREAGRTIVVREFAHGRVLDLGEVNGYHDSDFYAIYWDDASATPKRCEYATTRFPTYYAGADIDATPEVLERYDAWQRERNERLERERSEAIARKHAEMLAAIDLDAEQFERLKAGCSYRVARQDEAAARLNAAIALLKTRAANRFRSDFRRKLADQVHAFAIGESQYESPLSARQWECILRF